MNDIQYKTGGLERPHLSRKMRLIMYLNRIPLIQVLFRRIIMNFYHMPSTTSFSPGFYCSAPLLELGEYVGLGDTFIVAYAPIKIGSHVSMSFHNTIITSSHDIDDFSTVIGKPVTIGNNVWITSNVTILPGVTIGDNTIIGAGSVVTRDIPSNVFAAGNPCKVVKTIEFHK